MNFNSDGYLEAGLHDLEFDEIVEHFVTAFPHSTSRQPIINGYSRHSDELRKIGLSCQQLLNGSFVSSKADPGDIDMVGFIDFDAVDALGPVDQQKLLALFNGKLTKDSHCCDAYFSPIVPESHPLFNKFRSQRKYWMGEFGYDREDRPKGIIRTHVVPVTPEADQQSAPDGEHNV